MKNEPTAEVNELHDIIDQKLTAFIREMEDANWSAEEVAFAINDVLRAKWLAQAEALQGARRSIPKNFVSDGNEG